MMETSNNEIHGHEVMRMMLESGQVYDEERLEAVIQPADRLLNGNRNPTYLKDYAVTVPSRLAWVGLQSELTHVKWSMQCI